MPAIGFGNAAIWSLRPADVIYTRSSGIVGAGIRHFTQHAGEPESFTEHAALVMIPPEMSEAVAGGIKRQSIHRLNAPGRRAVAFRVPGLTEADRNAIYNAALNREGEPYPYLTVFGLHFLDAVLFHSRYVLRRFGVSGHNYCNAHVQWALSHASTPQALFREQLNEGDPDSMLDEQIRRGHQLVWADSESTIDLLGAIYPSIKEVYA